MDRTIDNKYRLLRELGQGGMGSVYEAEHLGVGRRVALKLLHKTVVDADPKNLGRLQREARLAGTLESPHIAQVSDVGVDPATKAPYLVLEYLEGMDLDQVLRIRGRLPWQLALRIAAQTCVGLKKAHEAGIIHRDIKPANLFLSQREEDVVVKILDFGIAKPAADQLASLEKSALTRTGTLIGSPLYMSPEQARGLKTIDHRADIWSLGVVLFNMLAGKTPNHEVDALGELILVICSVASPSVRDYEPGVPMKVAEIVQRALSILPEHRFASATEMYDAMIAALETNAKGSARHAIDISELPAVEHAARASREAHKSREVHPAAFSSSAPHIALEQTELRDSSEDIAGARAKTVQSSPDLVAGAAFAAGAAPPSLTASSPSASGEAALSASGRAAASTLDAPERLVPRNTASVEAVVHSPTAAAAPRSRTWIWAAAAAAGAGVALAYGVLGGGTAAHAPMSGASAPTATAAAAETARAQTEPTATAAETAAPIETAAPTESALPSASSAAPEATTPAISGGHVAGTAKHVPSSTPSSTAARSAAPADTTTFGGRK